jgi:hypothetical protein
MPGRRCARRDCRAPPTVGRPDGVVPTHCGAHAPWGSVPIAERPCGVIGCEFASTYGPPGGRPTHCRVHAPPGAVAYQTGSQRCAVVRCGIEPTFMAPGATLLFCRKHLPRGAPRRTAQPGKWWCTGRDAQRDAQCDSK